ncbi:MAG: ABC transporter substrate-binding protein [Ilumatobacteraceae bacterium]|nr:ABC transporter substrate-binding protein [Ilumatobacteraceae bacterium]
MVVETIGATVVDTTVVDATAVDALVVATLGSGAAPVVLAATVVGNATEVDTTLVIGTTSFVDVTSVDCGAVATVPQPDNAKAAITVGNQRLSVRLRCASTRLIPLDPMSRRMLLVGVAVMFLVAGCGQAAPSSDSDARFILSQDFPLPTVKPEEAVLPTSVTGADGVVVQVTDTSRIIVLNEAIAEIVVSLGLQNLIIGRDATTTLAALAEITEVSSGHDISAESILSLRPTVVIGDTRTGPPEAIQQLRGAGVPVLLAPEVWSLSALPQRVLMIAQALGVPRAGQDLVAFSEKAVADALQDVASYAAVPRVAFLYVRGTASVYLLGGSGSGADELLAAAGAIDVGAYNGLSSFTPLTAEAIVQANPDVLLVMTRGLDSVGGIDGLLGLPGISSTRAAKSRAVIAVDDDLLLSFGPRTGALISRLAELLDMYSSDT